MSNKEKAQEPKLVTWVKKDGKTEVKLNDSEANIKAAKDLGWKKK